MEALLVVAALITVLVGWVAWLDYRLSEMEIDE